MIKLRLQIFAVMCGFIASMHGASSSYSSDNFTLKFIDPQEGVHSVPSLQDGVHIVVPTRIMESSICNYLLYASTYRYNTNSIETVLNSGWNQEDISLYIDGNIPNFPLKSTAFRARVSWGKAFIPGILSFLSYACALRITDSVTRAYCAAAGVGLLGAGLLYWQTCKNLPKGRVRKMEADLLQQYLIPHIEALKDSLIFPSTRLIDRVTISSESIDPQTKNSFNCLFESIQNSNALVIERICYNENNEGYSANVLNQPAVWCREGDTIPDRIALIKSNAFWTSMFGALGAMGGLGAHYVLTHGGLTMKSIFK